MQTVFDFTLPRGYVDGNGEVHKNGRMRLATAVDEISATRDPRVLSNPSYLTNAAQTTGLFGLRAEPKDLSERLVSACRQAGLFTMSRCTDDPNTLAELIRKGVNFIETHRPDITAALLPAGEAEPHGIPLRY